MKKKVLISITILLIVLSLVFVAFIVSLLGKFGMTTSIIADSNEVLLNPGKGFVDYGNMGKDADDVVAIGYHRFNWADVEPSEGNINFEKIDDKINYYAKKNKKFAFGIMCVNTSSTKEYITPEYVFKKGARSVDAKLPGGTYQKVPDWQDETFLNCVDNFVQALGKRYNGNKDIAFIDILSYGNWGEQHLFHLDVESDPDYMEHAKISPEFFLNRYVKPYMDAFPDTLLINPWGQKDFNAVYEQLIDQGVTLRRDGIVSYTNGLDMLAKCYGKPPTVFEHAKNYEDYIPDREQYFNDRLEEAIAIAKPSYIELDRDWYLNNKEYCAELANRMGYYFRLKQAQYYKKIKLNKNTTINLTFKNDGIAPIYENCFVYLALLDDNGNLVKKIKTDINPKTWLPGVLKKETINLNFGNVKKGEYNLAVGLFLNETDENPTYLLGSKGKTENSWYVFGKTKIG